MTAPTTALVKISRVKSCRASSSRPSPIFFITTALPPVASIPDTAVMSPMAGAVRLMADRAAVPMRLETNRPSTMV